MLSRCSYYIYAIRGLWMDRFKIGFFIGDLKLLIKRYKTYYGSELELCVFEVMCDREDIIIIENKIFKKLSTYHCGSGELYFKNCLEKFLTLGLRYCNNNVTIPLKLRKKKKEKKETSDINYPIIFDPEFKKDFKNINNIIREHYDQVVNVERKITNIDLLPCNNGNIDLKTGSLVKDGIVYQRIDIDYPGLDYDVSDIDKFMSMIFDNNIELIGYMQRLLGYAITGHSKEQCMIIFCGRGSNGKSLLLAIIEELLGYYCTRASDEVFFKYRNIKGQPTSHLTALRDKRICIREETSITRELNLETLKEITGNNKILARNHYDRHYIEFQPTVLPILSCNNKPKIDIKDDSISRRIIVIPFNMTFTSINDHKIPYDMNNPNHKIRDFDLKDNLLSADKQKQLLVWLIKGSIEWYKNGLNTTPEIVRQAFHQYYDENDHVTYFINDYCVQNKNKSISIKIFRDLLIKEKNIKIKQDDLMTIMKNKGFEMKKVRGVRLYSGLDFK